MLEGQKMTATSRERAYKVARRTSAARVWTASSCLAPTSIWASMSRRGRAPGLADRLHRQRRHCGRAGGQGRRLHRRPIRSATCRPDRPGLWERLHITEEPPPRLAGRQRAGRRDGSATTRWLISEEGLARYTEAGLAMLPVDAQPDRCGLDRSAAAATGARRAASAGLRRASAEEKREQIAAPAAGREAGCGGAQRSGLDRLAAEHPRRRRAVHAVRARLRHGPCGWRHRAVHGSRQAARGDPRLAGQRSLGGGARGARAGAGAAGGQDACGSIRPGRRCGSRRLLRSAGRDRGGRPRSVPAAEGLQERRSSSRARAMPIARDAVAVCRFLHLLSEAGPRGGETEMSAAAKLLASAPAGRRVPRREFPRDFRCRRARRDHPLPGHRGDQPADPAERGLPDRLRRAVSRRHDRHHAHGLDRPRRAAAQHCGNR